MFKLISYPIMFILICYGVWLLLAAGQYKDKFVKAKDWNTVQGRVVMRDEGVHFQIYNPMTWHQILVCQPSITFAYTVNGKRIEKTDKLPPCLMLVRIATRGDYDPNGVDEENEPTFRQMMEESAAVRAKHPREPVDISKHIYMQDGKVQFRSLGKLMDATKISEEERDVFRPRVEVKYRAGDPEEAVTDKDMIKGYEAMFNSGVWGIIIGIVGAAALFFHQWVTKPSQEDIDMQFQGRPSIKY